MAKYGTFDETVGSTDIIAAGRWGLYRTMHRESQGRYNVVENGV
jgi:hypothetical protein